MASPRLGCSILSNSGAKRISPRGRVGPPPSARGAGRFRRRPEPAIGYRRRVPLPTLPGVPPLPQRLAATVGVELEQEHPVELDVGAVRLELEPRGPVRDPGRADDADGPALEADIPLIRGDARPIAADAFMSFEWLCKWRLVVQRVFVEDSADAVCVALLPRLAVRVEPPLELADVHVACLRCICAIVRSRRRS